ncbi:hypothetical protein [Acinetobacter sp. ANC 5378]|uniref:hypothetical protein n=1 Tax=Acinetobacter sp. ANC 5378 TaxID=2731249 RepID=UPI00148F88FB|nr:hypothetical protein [Acinetobacter sp. ANC 5378]NNG82931.1 hypothetical protein [Acinetobacter sp. ANC 5378]
MKKIALITTLLIVCGKASALTCSQLSKIADDNSIMYGTKYSFVVKGQKGFRTYFHSAPSAQCKIKQLFLIPKDSVVAYQEFKNENKTWLYIMYIDKNGKDTSGWMLERDFKISGSLSP